MQRLEETTVCFKVSVSQNPNFYHQTKKNKKLTDLYLECRLPLFSECTAN